MQSLVLPPSFVAPDLGHLRYLGPERQSSNHPRPANARRCTPRDLPHPGSMSSSVKTQDPLETLGNARRPGRPDLPQPVTTAAVSAAGATAVSTGLSGSIISPVSPNPVIAHESSLQQRVVAGPGDETLRHPLAFSETFTSTRLPQSFTGQVPSQPVTATYSQPTFGTSPAGPASRALPQKTTRRTKAHVASACVNCKKKHLGCDPARPCRRCVLSGKQDTCVDVTHKKRGRPPLKTEEGSIRPYTTQMDSRGLPGDQGLQSRRSMHRATSSRELRPMTDLQMHGQAGPMGLRLAPGQSQRWPMVYPHGIDPSLTSQRIIGHRRFSSSGSTQSLTTVSPTGYTHMPVGYNPALAAGRPPPGAGRSISYSNQGMHPVPSPPQYQQYYGIPISPYPENTRVASRMQMGESSTPRDAREGVAESPVRLPPIYPSPVANSQPPQPPQTHRSSDTTTWSPSQQYSQELRQQAGFMDPISPSNQMRQSAPEFGYMNQLGGVSPIEGQPQQLPSTRTYEQRGPESDDGDPSRPTKRRKMALDDMVND
ncbi:hypothetical protein BJX99DRAFT_267001 [Aspergillus californicus]